MTMVMESSKCGYEFKFFFVCFVWEDVYLNGLVLDDVKMDEEDFRCKK